MNIRKQIKQAAYWAAFFVLATAAVLLVSLIGAELAGASSQAGWALAKLATILVAIVSLIGWLCEQLED